MIPDSKIAESQRQAETKTKYVIQCGIAAHFRKSMLKDFKDQPFTFKFDKSAKVKFKNNMMYMYNFGLLYTNKL